MPDQSIGFDVHPIGVIHSPFKEAKGAPIQPVYAADTRFKVELFPQYVDGLKDLAGFERVWLIYWFHRAPAARLVVIPFRDSAERGLFATRAPCRPVPVGLSCVRLIAVRDNLLICAGADILDGAPLLDIKPYVPEFDAFPNSRAGWFDESKESRRRADDRFERLKPRRSEKE